MAAPDSQLLIDEVVRGHRAALARLARSEGLMGEEALDCVHDALCTFLTRPKLEELTRSAQDQRRVLEAMVRNAARNRRRRHDLALEHVPLEDSTLVDSQERADAQVDRAEQTFRLRVCVDELCDHQRSVVLMRLLEERPGDDVASALGLARGNVDVILHRAKAALRECMARGPRDPLSKGG